LEVKPLDEITVRDIAARSGVGYTTFFRHHPSKEAMLREIVTEQVGRLLELSLPELDGGDLQSASRAIFSYVNDHRGMWSTLLNGGAAALVREDFLRLGADAAASRLPPGKWLPADMGLALIVSGTLTLLTMWLRQSDPMPTKRMVEIYIRVVLSPVMEVNEFGVPKKKGRRRARS
jgi:AcrR family transcriptional regulator